MPQHKKLFKFYCSCGKAYETDIYDGENLCHSCRVKRAKARATLHGMIFKGKT